MNNEYRLFYKCNLCGKIYSDTRTSKETAIFFAENLCTSESVNLHGSIVTRHDIHACGNGEFGFADFVGIMPVNSEE